MKKKLLSLFLPIALMLGMLTGCQSEKQVADDGETQQTEGTEESGEGDNVVSLTLWGAGEDGEMLAKMVESFKKEYAGQAEFDITIEAQGESDCKDRLVEDVEGAADIFAFADDQLRVLVAAGALAPVPNADAVKKANIEGACEAASVNGVLYAYPMTADNGYFLYYNKAYLSEEDVASMDTLLQKAAEAGKKVTMDWTSGWYLYAFFGGAGLELGLNEDGVSNYCNWNTTEAAVKGIDVAEAMQNIAANPGFLNGTDTEFVAGIQDDSVIAGVSGVWNTTAVADAWGDNYGATKLPTYTCAGNQVQMSSFAGYKMIGVNAYSEHVEWAQKLADWITNEASQTTRFVERGQGPSNINASNSSAVAESPAIQAILKQSEFASLQRVGSNYWDPMMAFGQTMADGNPQGRALQELLDTMVEGITKSYN